MRETQPILIRWTGCHIPKFSDILRTEKDAVFSPDQLCDRAGSLPAQRWFG
jgi:hypothetical protein